MRVGGAPLAEAAGQAFIVIVGLGGPVEPAHAAAPARVARRGCAGAAGKCRRGGMTGVAVSMLTFVVSRGMPE
jgi:hypothetical protein